MQWTLRNLMLLSVVLSGTWGCATADPDDAMSRKASPDGHEAIPLSSTEVVVLQPIHFEGGEEVDVVVEPGKYYVEASGNVLVLKERDGLLTYTLEAVPQEHEEELDGPVAFLFEDEGSSEQHLILLQPEGKGMSALGYAGGVRSRDGDLSRNRKQLTINQVAAHMLVRRLPDLAYRKKTRQSSTAFGGFPQRAVDGRTAGAWSQGSITHTKKEMNPWWEVDLGAKYDITKIEIWNRTDARYANRLSNFYITVSNKSGGSRQRFFRGNRIYNPRRTPQAQNPWSFTGNASGRFVRVHLMADNYLSLAEVRVLGTLAKTTSPSISVTAPTTVQANDVPIRQWWDSQEMNWRFDVHGFQFSSVNIGSSVEPVYSSYWSMNGKWHIPEIDEWLSFPNENQVAAGISVSVLEVEWYATLNIEMATVTVRSQGGVYNSGVFELRPTFTTDSMGGLGAVVETNDPVLRDATADDIQTIGWTMKYLWNGAIGWRRGECSPANGTCYDPLANAP